jgi:hypothetical protein
LADLPYNFLQRLLHRILLGNRFVAEFCLDLETGRIKVDADVVKQGKHVLVAGLARSGTTILMRCLHDTGSFTSLTYRDMPFVLMPVFWRRLSKGGRRQIPAAERAHGDGVLVGYDSPEAFEEVFWKTCDGPSYIRPDRLVRHEPDDEILEKYRRYIGLVLRSRPGGPQRYLSKNNNNILRLASLGRALPSGVVFIPFRSPLQHAYSLLRQHERFVARSEQDPFSVRYMTWLGHHEFGADHRPFSFTDAANPFRPEELDYWLVLWRSVYEWVLETAPEQAAFVSYEQLCSDGGRTWGRLLELTGIESRELPVETLRLVEHEIPHPYSRTWHDACRATHERLLARHVLKGDAAG